MSTEFKRRLGLFIVDFTITNVLEPGFPPVIEKRRRGEVGNLAYWGTASLPGSSLRCLHIG